MFQDGGRLAGQHSTIEEQVRETLGAVRERLDVSGVVIRVGPGPDYLIPEIGLGGRTNGTDDIQLSIDPAFPQLGATLQSELLPLLAHELHHIARHRTAGFSSNLFEAMVMEGLADHFSIEVAGIEPPLWARALTGVELQSWIAEAGLHWLDGPYDHARWFFGSNPAVPRWAGYTIGFELVARYLHAHPSRRASQLAGEPAASFMPAN